MLVTHPGRFSESSTLIKGGTGGKDAQQVKISEKMNLSHISCMLHTVEFGNNKTGYFFLQIPKSGVCKNGC